MSGLVGKRKDVIAVRKENECFTLKQIGDKCGLTRERVRQILSDEHLPTHRPSKVIGFTCNYCGNIFYDKNYMNRLFCSRECATLYHDIDLVCENCGEKFRRHYSEVFTSLNHYGNEHFYCSRKCMWEWRCNHDWGGRGIRGNKISMADLRKEFGNVSIEKLVEIFISRGITEIELVCENCGIKFDRKAALVKSAGIEGSSHFYCSKKCMGDWRKNNRWWRN